MNSSERRWLEVHQVANRLKVSTDTVYRMIKRKMLRALRFSVETRPGKRRKLCYRVAEDDLDQFIRAHYA